jgi:hypothetical protein
MHSVEHLVKRRLLLRFVAEGQHIAGFGVELAGLELVLQRIAAVVVGKR